MMTVTFSPLVPWPLLAALAVLALAAVVPALLRRVRGGWLRLAALVVLVVILAGPRGVSRETKPLPDVAVVVVDDSPSQGIGDRPAQTEAALAELRTRLGQMPGLDVRVERVAGAEDGTQLFTALGRVLADVPRQRLAGVVMITDGQVHDGPADAGASLGAPLHVLLTGHRGERDRRLVMLDNPAYALVGRTAILRLRVDDPGTAGSARIDIRLDGSPYLSAEVPLNRDASVEVPIPHAGANVVELDAAAGPHEVSLANNRAVVGISGIRDRLKVLLISGEPNPGERTWRNLLKADPAVDLVHFTILRPPEKDDGTPLRELALITFPVRELFEDKLKDFDLVVFDRYRRRGVLPARTYQALADYVRGGGALLNVAGPEFAGTEGLYVPPLSDILPAEPTGTVLEQPFRPIITEDGRNHPVTAGLAGSGEWGQWLRQVPARQKAGRVILSGIDGLPLVVVDRVGDGRVAEILSDSVWLWARGWEGGGPHNELLRRLAHWLMREPDLEEEALSAEIRAGRLEILRRSMVAQPAEITVTRPDGAVLTLPLTDHGDGRATAGIAADHPGLWRVEDGTRTAIAAAGTLAPLEMTDLAATDQRLAPVVVATGGSVHWLEAGLPDVRRTSPGRVSAGSSWIGLQSRGDAVVTGLRELPLVPGPLVLVLALGGLLWAWRREGR
jgi:hypothetical protein